MKIPSDIAEAIKHVMATSESVNFWQRNGTHGDGRLEDALRAQRQARANLEARILSALVGERDKQA